jgi:hypothetical protein
LIHPAMVFNNPSEDKCRFKGALISTDAVRRGRPDCPKAPAGATILTRAGIAYSIPAAITTSSSAKT